MLMRAVEAASDALYREEARGGEPRRTDAQAEVDQTKPEQRRADAVGLLAERALAAGFGNGNGNGDGESDAPISGTRAERYQVMLHVDAETLRETGDPGLSELEDGSRVSAETSRRIACDASLVRIALGPDGQVLGAGRKTRTVPPSVRRALEARDRGCRFPGCGSRFTEAHHVKHWADGGETSLAKWVSPVSSASPSSPRGRRAALPRCEGAGRVLHPPRESAPWGAAGGGERGDGLGGREADRIPTQPPHRLPRPPPLRRPPMETRPRHPLGRRSPGLGGARFGVRGGRTQSKQWLRFGRTVLHPLSPPVGPNTHPLPEHSNPPPHHGLTQVFVRSAQILHLPLVELGRATYSTVHSRPYSVTSCIPPVLRKRQSATT